jgi:threonine dehydratase
MPSSANSELPGFDDVKDAAGRLAGRALPTPLLESALLNDALGFRLLVKAEVLQRTGSFKFRGAYNRISRFTAAERRRGVVAYSSGNHAQGVAAAAKVLGAPATIVMPKDAPALKIANTRAYGAEIVFYDRLKDDREAIGARIAAERGLMLVKPYDDRYVIAGQGTVGLEVAGDARARGIALDALIVPCGGGGLISGCALAMAEESPGTKVYAAEPAGWDDTGRSLEAGTRLSNPPGGSGLCDALLAPTPGEMTFALNSRLLAGAFAVDDAAVYRAMAAAFRHLKLVVEPGGAVALAAALANAKDWQGETVVCVLSGGNVDPALFADVLAKRI